MKKFMIIYIVIGLCLSSLILIFKDRDTMVLEHQLINEAYTLDTSSLWPSLSLSNYPIAIRNNQKEYVFFQHDMTKRKPFFPVIVATAYQVNDRIEVFMPSKKTMENLGQLMEGVSSNQALSLIEGFAFHQQTLSNDQYMAMIFHEALHAYQIEYYEHELFNQLPEGFDERKTLQLISTIDQSEFLKSFYLSEYQILEDAITNPDLIPQFLLKRQARIDQLHLIFTEQEVEHILFLENYYEKIEGTARYLESQVLFTLGNLTLYNQYKDKIDEYQLGKEKYYRSGMGVCMLLDHQSTSWKAHVFSNTQPLDQLLITHE